MTEKENKYKNTLKQAISTYGMQKQTLKAIEELSELSQALCKGLQPFVDDEQIIVFEKLEDNYQNIFEEIADVTIMLDQCKLIFECESEVQNWIDKKIERLEQRLKESDSQ